MATSELTIDLKMDISEFRKAAVEMRNMLRSLDRQAAKIAKKIHGASRNNSRKR